MLPAFRQGGSEKSVNTMRQGLWEAIHDSVCCIRQGTCFFTYFLPLLYLFSLHNIKKHGEVSDTWGKSKTKSVLGFPTASKHWLCLTQKPSFLEEISHSRKRHLYRTSGLPLYYFVWFSFIFILRYNLHIWMYTGECTNLKSSYKSEYPPHRSRNTRLLMLPPCQYPLL